MNLRIAHVLNSPGKGGVPRVAHALVRHLDPAKFANHVFYLKAGDGVDLFEGFGCPRHVAKSGSKAKAMTELVAWLEGNRIDILHTHSFRPNLYARMAGAVLKPSGLKLIAHYHNDYSDKWHGETLVLERRLADLTDAAVAVSGAVADHVAEHSGLRAAVLENGVDLGRVTGGKRAAGRAALGLPADVPTVGLIGRVCHQKGVDTFVEAAIRLCARLPDARFVVVGDTEDSDLSHRLLGRIASAGQSDRITFAGHREDMADVFAAIDLLVAPSRWEGFGLVLVEAMAAGVPVVASRVGGIPGVVGRGARLVPPENAGALAAAIEALVPVSDERTALVRRGTAEVCRFDWARSAERLAAHYCRLAETA